jgi:hypothetical protein
MVSKNLGTFTGGTGWPWPQSKQTAIFFSDVITPESDVSIKKCEPYF